MATLSQVSNAEDILEGITGGARVVRSQFCRVPLDLVIDCTKLQALDVEKSFDSMPGILSHESLPKMAFRHNNALQISSVGDTGSQPSDNFDAGNWSLSCF